MAAVCDTLCGFEGRGTVGWRDVRGRVGVFVNRWCVLVVSGFPGWGFGAAGGCWQARGCRCVGWLATA